MQISNIVFANWTGWVEGKNGRTAQVSCSKRRPCRGIVLQDVNLAPSEGAKPVRAQGSCSNIEPGGVKGLTGSGC